MSIKKKYAMAFFEKVFEVGVRSNEITFIGVLDASCHVRLIKEG